MLGQEELEGIEKPDIITNQIALLEAQCHEMKPNLGSIAEYNKKVSICDISLPLWLKQTLNKLKICGKTRRQFPHG